MKRYFVLLAIILGMVAPSVLAQTATPKKKVAVYMTGNDVQDSYKKVIGAKLVSAITATNEYAAVERTADFLAAISAESDYQTSGEVRDSQIAALGQKFGVRYVVVADVSEVFDEVFITARMINVETGLVEKAFDTNGPAESMAQLVSLSKSVANGLDLSSSQDFSEEPLLLSLCVMDLNGKTQYITTEQWQSISETKKLDYNKKGVVIVEKSGEAFIVAMRDKGNSRWWFSGEKPSESQGKLIFKYKFPLNNALRIFGGEPLGECDYWINKEYNTYYAYYVDMTDGHIETQSQDKLCQIREVATVLP